MTHHPFNAFAVVQNVYGGSVVDQHRTAVQPCQTISHWQSTWRTCLAMSLFLGASLALILLTRPAFAEEVGTIRQCLFSSPTYEAVWHPGSKSETLALNLTPSDFVAKDRALRAQGWKLRQLHTINNSCDGVDSLSTDALWVLDPSVSEAWVYAWSYADFNKKYQEMLAQGWRVTLFDSFTMNNGVHYSAVWRPSSADQVDIYSWSSADFVNKLQSLYSQGWGLTFLGAHMLPDGTPRYNASWRRNISDTWVAGWAPQDFESYHSQLSAQGWRLYAQTLPGFGSNARYSAAWRRTNTAETRRTNLSRSSFVQQQQSLRGAGWNIELFTQHQ